MFDSTPNYSALSAQEQAQVLSNVGAVLAQCRSLHTQDPVRFPMLMTSDNLPGYVAPTDPPDGGVGAFTLRFALTVLSDPI